MSEVWPSWALTWYGRLFRTVVGFWGLALSGVLVGTGYFTAVGFTATEANWTPIIIGSIVVGFGFGFYTLLGAFRPTRRTFLPTAALFGMYWTVLAFKVVADWARSLS